MRKIKKFFRQLDMFPAPATFRIREDPEMTNCFAGVISLVFLILFVYVFIGNLIQTVDKQRIEYTVTDEKLLKNGTEFETDSVMYALKIKGMSVQKTAKIFAMQVTLNNENFSGVYMEQCTPSHWKVLGDDYEEQFWEKGLEDYFCLPKGYILKNTEEQENYTTHLLTVDICDQNITPQCLSRSEAIDQLITFTSVIKHVTANLAMFDTGFTPSNRNPTIRFVNDDTVFTFSESRTVQMFVDYSRYRIETDESIMPWENQHIEEGVYHSFTNKDNFENEGLFPCVYLHFRLRLKQKTIKRIVGKFDELLSYSGGLFAIIISFLSFFLISFNEYRYEILVAQGAFSYDQRGKKVKLADLNFLFYIKYSIFDWLNTLFFLDLKWGKCKTVDDTRYQLNKQLDTTLIMRRLQHIERCVFSTIDQDYKMGMYMQRSEHLEQVKLNRMYLEYFDWIIQGQEALTAENVETAENIFKGPSQTNEDFFRKSILKSSRIRLNMAMKKFPELEEEAASIQLTEQQLQVERKLALAFKFMNSKIKGKIQTKIPLKILHRFKIYEKINIQSLNFQSEEMTESYQ